MARRNHIDIPPERVKLNRPQSLARLGAGSFFGVDEMSKASWIYQDVPLSKIIDHPVNSAIYGDNFDDALVESIKQTEGVIEPVHLVKHEGGSFVCLSGHRRRQATAIAGFQTIAAMVYRGEMTSAEQVIHVIEANR